MPPSFPRNLCTKAKLVPFFWSTEIHLSRIKSNQNAVWAAESEETGGDEAQENEELNELNENTLYQDFVCETTVNIMNKLS